MEPMPDAVRTIRDFLLEDGAVEHIDDDDELLGTGLMDSVGVLGLVTKLEESFDLQIEMEHLTEDNFRSVRAIADLVHRLIAQRNGN